MCWQPAGNVGTGFDSASFIIIKKQLNSLTAKSPSFDTEKKDSEGVTWVRPELVAEVKFAERTNDGRLRAPVFLRLREDKPGGRRPSKPRPSKPHKNQRKGAHEKYDKNRKIYWRKLDNKETNLVLDYRRTKNFIKPSR